MISLKQIALYWRTAKHLKFIQVYYRLRRMLYPKRVPRAPHNVKIRDFKQRGFLRVSQQSVMAQNQFRFLNRDQDLSFPEGWNNKSLPKLWLYNLHYFDYLLCNKTSEQQKVKLIEQWVSGNPPMFGEGWEPYPSSLRIANWIKWAWFSEKLPALAVESLYLQTLALEQQIEFHLLGNHLLENAKALVFAGVFFEGADADRWLAIGVRIFKKELEEQILNDGAHFELSPMYHSLMLELVCDIALLARNNNCPSVLQKQQEFFVEKASGMASWLRTTIHPDGQISFFNDSAEGIAKSPSELISFCEDIVGKKVGKRRDPFVGESGLVRIERQNAVVFFDIGEIGPSYLPGHAHADSLSIEMSLFGKRLFVNGGVSQYGLSEQREKERGTAAHSTLEIAGQNSSEIWSGFRVGRRARVQNIDIEQTNTSFAVSAEHDGYAHLKGHPLHRRRIDLSTNKLIVEDVVNCVEHESTIRLHLHPDVHVEIGETGNEGRLYFDNGKSANYKNLGAKTFIEPFEYSPEFGTKLQSSSLVIHYLGKVSNLFELTWVDRT